MPRRRADYPVDAPPTEPPPVDGAIVAADGPHAAEPVPVAPDTTPTVNGAPSPPAASIDAPPTPVELTVSVRRTVWTDNPRGSWEAHASMRATPAPGTSSVANLNRMHALLQARVETWIAEVQ